MTLQDSADEWFDLVDDCDQVIGRQTRSHVHRLGLRHRAVHIFLFRSDGRLLIHLRAPDKEEFPGVWTSSAAGHVSSGETYEQTAPRELSEELGVACRLERMHKFPACPDTCMEFTVLYRGLEDGDVTPDPAEIQRVEWVTPADLYERICQQPAQFSPAFRLLFDWYWRTQA